MLLEVGNDQIADNEQNIYCRLMASRYWWHVITTPISFTSSELQYAEVCSPSSLLRKASVDYISEYRELVAMFLGISTRSVGMGSNFELLRSTTGSVQDMSKKAGAVLFPWGSL